MKMKILATTLFVGFCLFCTSMSTGAKDYRKRLEVISEEESAKRELESQKHLEEHHGIEALNSGIGPREEDETVPQEGLPTNLQKAPTAGGK